MICKFWLHMHHPPRIDLMQASSKSIWVLKGEHLCPPISGLMAPARNATRRYVAFHATHATTTMQTYPRTPQPPSYSEITSAYCILATKLHSHGCRGSNSILTGQGRKSCHWACARWAPSAGMMTRHVPEKTTLANQQTCLPQK